MKPAALGRIHKAEEDWYVAQLSYCTRKYSSYDAAVFHAQQGAEKYLKVWLEEAAIGFARAHNLLNTMPSSTLKRNTLRGVLTQTRELDTVRSKFESTKI